MCTWKRHLIISSIILIKKNNCINNWKALRKTNISCSCKGTADATVRSQTSSRSEVSQSGSRGMLVAIFCYLKNLKIVRNAQNISNPQLRIQIVDSETIPMDAQIGQLEKEEMVGPRSTSLLSPQLKAMIRIKKKYLKKLRPEHGSNSARLGHNNSDGINSDVNLQPKRPKRKSRRRVMFPNHTLMCKPKRERSRAKPFLIFFSIIIFIQVYNAIENLDDHVLKYDLEGLEKTLDRELFGQQEALEELMDHLKDYLSTYTHHQPLALSFHGPSGVGKSHLGRVLTRHFRSVIGDKLVVQYFSKHHCPLKDAAQDCASKLAKRIMEVVTRAEEEEQIPFFILDEVELMQPPLLDVLKTFLRPDQTNEFLNVVYVFLSSLGQREITAHILHNASTAGAHKSLRQALTFIHPLWTEPTVEIIPLSLLEREHVIRCFMEEMTLEGFYSDTKQVEALADELAYHRAAGKQYAKTGCKQVVGKVNLL